MGFELALKRLAQECEDQNVTAAKEKDKVDLIPVNFPLKSYNDFKSPYKNHANIQKSIKTSLTVKSTNSQKQI